MQTATQQQADQSKPQPHQVAVVGGGVIGVCSALYLQKAGYDVTLYEKDDIAMGASYGNAGGFGITEVVPISLPGIIWKVPGWLMDPMGPLAIQWHHLHKRNLSKGKLLSLREQAGKLSSLHLHTKA